MINGDFFFASLPFTVRGGKINMGPVPSKFVTVPVALNLFSIVLTVDIGIFRRVAIF